MIGFNWKINAASDVKAQEIDGILVRCVRDMKDLIAKLSA